MSQHLFGDDVLFYQRLLKASGYLKGNPDGDWGPDTAQADAAFLADSAKLKQTLGTFDARSESIIAGLHIKAQDAARRFLKTATTGALTVRLISGTRSYAEQNKLYAKGRFGNPGPIVTNARGGQSNHNFCIAWDIGLFAANGRYLTGATNAETAEYRKIAVLVGPASLGLEWGGDWTTFVDIPHYQVRTGMKTSAVRALFESGQPYI